MIIPPEHKERMSELLVETEAYQDLDKPVILASGKLGIYYVNTEKLCQDNGKFNEYGEDSQKMIMHAGEMAIEHATFREAIGMICKAAERIFPYERLSQSQKYFSKCIISGGQRRDWLFSGPVSRTLDLEHIALYKDGKTEVSNSEGDLYESPAEIQGYECVHIVDLLTKGSSAYRKDGTKEAGWVPMLRAQGVQADNLIAVVTRLQGGEGCLKEQGVNVYSFVSIDENFLRNHSKNKEVALAYFKDPRAWSENYMRENGVSAFIGTFDPAGGKKLDKAKSFLLEYNRFLKESGKMAELETAVQTKYNKSLKEILK